MARRKTAASFIGTVLTICSVGLAQTQPALPGSAPPGRVQTVTVHGASLEGNLLGVTADRSVTVYLPAGYDGGAVRYPVVVLLHALGGSDVLFAATFQSNRDIPAIADRLIAAGTIQPMILVMPDASTPYGACFYANSPVCGNWDDYVTRDLVAYVDAHYRTLARPESRAVAGVDVGGYGALMLAAEHPDVFGAAYAMSPLNAAMVDPASSSLYSPEAFAMTEPDRALGLSPVSYTAKVQLGMAAIASPDAERPPYYVNLPVGIVAGRPQLRDAIWQRWVARTPLRMLEGDGPSLRAVRALGIDVGSEDREGNTLRNVSALDAALTRAGIAHRFEVYPGQFFSEASERLASTVLPFLSSELQPGARSAPAD